MSGVLGLQRKRTGSGAVYLARLPASHTDRLALLVHGLGSSAASWEPVARHAPDGLGLLIPDLPGFGSSPSGSLPPLEAAAEMVEELLEQYLGKTRITIVAHSVGTIVALQALQAVQHERVDRLVLVSGALLTASTIAASPRAVIANPTLTAMVAIHVMAAVTPLSTGCAAAIARNQTLKSALLWPFLAHPGGVCEPELMKVLPHPGGWQSTRAIWSARQVDLAALMARTEIPSRIIHGAEDRLIDREDIAGASNLLPSDDLLELEGCGHWPHIERPAETAAAAFRP